MMAFMSIKLVEGKGSVACEETITEPLACLLKTSKVGLTGRVFLSWFGCASCTVTDTDGAVTVSVMLVITTGGVTTTGGATTTGGTTSTTGATTTGVTTTGVITTTGGVTTMGAGTTAGGVSTTTGGGGTAGGLAASAIVILLLLTLITL